MQVCNMCSNSVRSDSKTGWLAHNQTFRFTVDRAHWTRALRNEVSPSLSDSLALCSRNHDSRADTKLNPYETSMSVCLKVAVRILWPLANPYQPPGLFRPRARTDCAKRDIKKVTMAALTISPERQGSTPSLPKGIKNRPTLNAR